MDHLLQEVLDLINSIVAKKEKVKLQQRSAENAKLMRDDFAENLLEPTTINSNEEVLPETVRESDENIVIEVIDGRYIIILCISEYTGLLADLVGIGLPFKLEFKVDHFGVCMTCMICHTIFSIGDCVIHVMNSQCQ